MIHEKSFTEFITIPFCKILMEGEKNGVRPESFLGKSNNYRNVFCKAYNQLERGEKLEDLPQDKKMKLWEDSIKYCPEDRLRWCRSVHFYRMVKC